MTTFSVLIATLDTSNGIIIPFTLEQIYLFQLDASLLIEIKSLPTFRCELKEITNI